MKHFNLMSSIVCVSCACHVNGQGFMNLDFEDAVIVPDPTSVYYPWEVYAFNAISGWTPYVNGIPQQNIFFNVTPISAAEVTLQDSESGFAPVEGQYTVWLFGQSRPGGVGGDSAAIGQTAQIPATSQSLVFWGLIEGTQITFDGQLLQFQNTGTTGSYSVYAADISAYAGQTGELLFTAPFNQGGIIDNIQFSNIPIPEPGVLSLFALGLLGLGWHGRRRG